MLSRVTSNNAEDYIIVSQSRKSTIDMGIKSDIADAMIKFYLTIEPTAKSLMIST